MMVIPMPIVRIWIKPWFVVRSKVIKLILWPEVYFTAFDLEIWLGKFIDSFEHRADYCTCHGNFTILGVNLRVQEALL
jgi:hypothetical protein